MKLFGPISTRLISRVPVIGVLLLFGLCACGSSAGGGGGSSAKTGVRVLHGGIDVTPLDLYSSDSQEILESTRFAGPALYAGLSQGLHTLSLTRARSPAEIVFTVPIAVEKNSRQSVLVYGNTESLGVHSALLVDDPGEIPKDLAAVRIVHALVGAASISATLGATEISSGVAFGSASAYVYVPVGVQTLTALRVTDGRQVFSGAKEVRAKKAYSYLITGEIDYLVVTPEYEDR